MAILYSISTFRCMDGDEKIIKMLLVLGLKIPCISQNPDELIALLIFFSAECQS